MLWAPVTYETDARHVSVLLYGLDQSCERY
jgi:hypothetical protein